MKQNLMSQHTLQTLPDGTELTEEPRTTLPTKYAINLAKLLFSNEELMNGIVEPLKENKIKVTLDQTKVNKIKCMYL